MTADPSNASLVGVVIVNWNAGDLLRQSVEGLRKQTHPPDRILILDNGSSDSSLQGLDQILPGIEIVRLKENAGFARGNNVAIRALNDCKWVALLNPDAVPERDWLAKLIQIAQGHPEYSFFGSRMVIAHKPNVLDGVGDVYHVSGRYWRQGHGCLSESSYLESQEIFSPCAAAALYRRDAWLEVGGFDESYFCYSEDVDLGFRLRLIGYRSLYVSEAVVRHVGSATTGGQHSDFAVYHGHRNLVWTYFKNMPWPLFWLYLPQHILLNVITLGWFSLRGQAKVIFKAKWDALKGLPQVLRERKMVQSKRRISAWALRRMMAKGLFRPYFRHRM